MFGEGNGLIGHQYFFLHGAPATYGSTGRRVPGVLAVPVRVRRHVLHDHVGRHGRSHRVQGRPPLHHRRLRLHLPDLRSLGVGSGRLARQHDGLASSTAVTGGTVFRDFAGSTVVHTVGGFIALAGAIVLGPRLGRKFKRDGGGPLPPHDLTIAAIGGVILWFGWYGFNPGSTLSAHGLRGHRPGRREHDARRVCRRAGRDVLGLSTLAEVGPGHVRSTGSSAGWWPSRPPATGCRPAARSSSERSPGSSCRSPSTSSSTSGWMTRSARWRSTGSAGSGARLSVGLFATGAFGIPTPDGVDTSTTVRGLFYGGGTDQLKAQFVGSITCIVVISAVAMALMYAREGDRHAARVEGGRARRPGHPRARHAAVPHGVRPRHDVFLPGEPRTPAIGSRSSGSRPIRTPMCQRSHVGNEDGARTTERSNGCHSW